MNYCAGNCTHGEESDGTSLDHESQIDITTNSAYGPLPSPVCGKSSTPATAQYNMKINPIYLLLGISSNTGYPNFNTVQVPEYGTPAVINQTGWPIYSQA